MSKPDTNFPFPPPIRKNAKRLTLKTAIAAAARSDSKIVKPLMDPLGEFPAIKTGEQTKIQSSLLELQADIIIREDFINEKIVALNNREREINEREALLEAHLKLEAAHSPDTNSAQSSINSEELEAFENLKKELIAQEASLKEARKSLQEREDFIVQCENELVEKSMDLTEQEAQIEQREEDHKAKVNRDKADKAANAKAI